MAPIVWARRPDLRRPVAVLAFAGWNDAGEAATGAVEHLIASLEGEAFARIDPDDFYDFQARRPEVEMTASGVRSLHWPRNEFHALHHPRSDLVVVLGEEPTLRWRAFGDAVAEVLVGLSVESALLLGAFLGPVPHTLPVPLVGSSADPGLLAANGIASSRYEGPTGIVGSLTLQLAERGLSTMSMWAAVPHYLSNQPYPPATHALVRQTCTLLGVDLDWSGLAAAAAEFRLQVDTAVADNEELAQYVIKLEGAADEDFGEPSKGGPREESGLVEEIERFLRDG